MKIIMPRIYSNLKTTIGIMMLDEVEQCFSLEDAFRTKKVYGKTRIPADTYKVILRTAGRLHEKYKKLFPWHRGMLWLQDVKGFSWIYIHIGLRHQHTLGCPLVSVKAKILEDDDNTAKIELEQSTIAYEKLYKKVVDEAEAGNLYIQIKDN